MKRINTLIDDNRVSAARIPLMAALFSISVFGGLVACSDRDNQLRNSRTAQSENRTTQTDEARRSSQGQRDSAQRDSAQGASAQQYGADNTGRNQRDRADGSRTADSQAMSGNDNKILAEIRREITRNDDMSTNAKNVMMIPPYFGHR